MVGKKCKGFYLGHVKNIWNWHFSVDTLCFLGTQPLSFTHLYLHCLCLLSYSKGRTLHQIHQNVYIKNVQFLYIKYTLIKLKKRKNRVPLSHGNRDRMTRKVENIYWRSSLKAEMKAKESGKQVRCHELKNFINSDLCSVSPREIVKSLNYSATLAGYKAMW